MHVLLMLTIAVHLTINLYLCFFAIPLFLLFIRTFQSMSDKHLRRISKRISDLSGFSLNLRILELQLPDPINSYLDVVQ